MIRLFLEFESACAAITLMLLLTALSMHAFRDNSGHDGLSQACVTVVNAVIFILSIWGHGWQAGAAIYVLGALLTGYLVWHLRGTLRTRDSGQGRT